MRDAGGLLVNNDSLGKGRFPDEMCWQINFAKNFKRLMDQTGTKYSDIERLHGVNYNTLYSYLNCSRPLPGRLFIQLSRHFGKSLDWMIEDHDEER